ncbi:hypothetical protein COT94_01150 [Candidatus Falkowbacteria bacterium CG10_big_fil_rev_8_21_14_0_10_37_14]|uniref:3D domain-containing protein n=1 Tax=Candidatus Falkowbacteria bacterium CG10_big_fil_rev_8_21_14_0_10_37_14 TaxID=1974561 RepID=A0A2M6WU73_9BACT|nr:hypothetical protein [Candidatus Falkowbacteria bacterium]PIT96281.1 MAG: hypothetical protein COT94_01150 [Candidatus Falkowbacteria bacterium CG10_big_fil_rev_8_21_14_0_10_37_14]
MNKAIVFWFLVLGSFLVNSFIQDVNITYGLSAKTLEKKVVYKKARITKYVKTGKKMANGRFPKVGYVAVSDRKIHLGSLVWIGKRRYIVGDYTSKKIQTMSLRKNCDLTIDVFTNESAYECLNFGVETHKVAILVKS